MAAAGPVHGAFDDDGRIAIQAGGESLIGPDFCSVVGGDGVAGVGGDGMGASEVGAVVEHVSDGNVGRIRVGVL